MTLATKSAIPLSEALDLASQLVIAMQPLCRRVVTAGSIRRQKPTVGDIELVAIPNPDMFGAFLGPDALGGLSTIDGVGTFTKNGDRYKQFTYRGRQVDLFLTDPDRWGVILAIRTGPANFSQRMMVHIRDRGMRVHDGALWDAAGEQVAVPTEQAFFAAIGWDWIPPKERR